MPEPDTPPAEAAAHRRPFAAWLTEQRGGSLHGELTEKLADLVAACLEHGEGGSLVLTVKVKPNKDGVTVTVTDEVKAKEPEGDRGAALFYADAEGNLSRRDPRQPELPLKDISATSADDLREVS